jgi:hypothetical protein
MTVWAGFTVTGEKSGATGEGPRGLEEFSAEQVHAGAPANFVQDRTELSCSWTTV